MMMLQRDLFSYRSHWGGMVTRGVGVGATAKGEGGEVGSWDGIEEGWEP